MDLHADPLGKDVLLLLEIGVELHPGLPSELLGAGHAPVALVRLFRQGLVHEQQELAERTVREGGTERGAVEKPRPLSVEEPAAPALLIVAGLEPDAEVLFLHPSIGAKPACDRLGRLGDLEQTPILRRELVHLGPRKQNASPIRDHALLSPELLEARHLGMVFRLGPRRNGEGSQNGSLVSVREPDSLSLRLPLHRSDLHPYFLSQALIIRSAFSCQPRVWLRRLSVWPRTGSSIRSLS